MTRKQTTRRKKTKTAAATTETKPAAPLKLIPVAGGARAKLPYKLPSKYEIVLVETAALVPYARNARMHTEQQVAQLRASIREFGWTYPMLIDSRGEIIAGHGRILAAYAEAFPVVPVIVMDHLSEVQKRALRIADNKHALNSTWDMDLLADEMRELHALDPDLDTNAVGYSEAEFTGMEEIGNDPDTNGMENNVPPPALSPVTRRGDVWLCGPHRVLCGDSRVPADVANVMKGARINLAFTSPPYAEQREYDKTSGFKPVHPDEYVEWFEPIANNITKHFAPDGSFFINIKPSVDVLDTSLYVFDLVIAHVRRWGWHFATEFCWERNGVPKKVTQRFKNQFEPIYQFVKNAWKMRAEAVRHESDNVPVAQGRGNGDAPKGGFVGNMANAQGRRRKNGTRGGGGEEVQGTNWQPGEFLAAGMAYPGNRLPTFTSSHEATGHAAAFPVGLPRFFILAYTDRGDVVYDPFGGSGSTMIAAEDTHRVARLVEISPGYVDVIVRRWQEFTKSSAVRESDGCKFDDAGKPAKRKKAASARPSVRAR